MRSASPITRPSNFAAAPVTPASCSTVGVMSTLPVAAVLTNDSRKSGPAATSVFFTS